MKWCKNKEVLDFGCGFGGFIKGMQDVAKCICGVEISTTERNYLTVEGISVENKIEKFGKKFDVITLFHVFEHLFNPREWLTTFANYIKEDGMLFIEVPNANDALLSLYESPAFADFTYWSAHLYLYTKESLIKIINDNGCFEIEEAGQFQRYPLSNHLYWLSKGKPGGQNKWQFLNSEILNKEYTRMLEEANLCDTLLFRLRKKSV